LPNTLNALFNKIKIFFAINKMETAYQRDPYYAQSNDPRDLYHAHFNLSQVRQQERLSGGSWSQPVWNGWKPIIGAGHSSFLQKYAQDGDSGFFYGGSLHGCGEPVGMNPLPPNAFETIEQHDPDFATPKISTIQPVIVQPDPVPDPTELEMEANFSAEPQQRAVYVPPYSQSLYQGMGRSKDENDVLYEEPLEIPQYKGGFHRKENLIKRRK
jgi:hypothetical protein